MSKDTAAITAARAEARVAREQMLDTARELQDRLSPAVLAHSAWQGAKSKGADLADEAVDVVRSRPAIATGVVAAVALFLARAPLMDMAGKLAGGITTKKTRKSKTRTKSKNTETIA